MRVASRGRLVLVLVVVVALGGSACTACKKKSEPTYGDKMVGAMREASAADARGDMQAMALAVTQWVSNDGNLGDATDYDTLIGVLQPAWIRVAPRLDPWSTPYIWKTDGSSWELRSAGRDKTAGNQDDVVMVDGQVTQMPKSFQPMARP